MTKLTVTRAVFCGLAFNLAVVGQRTWADDAAPKTEAEKVGYALGMNIGSNVKKMNETLKSAGLAMDVDSLVKGMKDTLAGGPTQLSTNDVRTILTDVQEKVQAGQAAEAKTQGDKTIKEGQDFLDKNKTQPGVVALADGLQYKILKEGSGPKPKLSDTVSVNYRGTLINGEEFDASKPGNPIKFPLTGVIPGWTEILQLMPTGSKWQVFIPSALAYGPRSAGPKISPNSTLIFEIELLAIVPPSAAAP